MFGRLRHVAQPLAQPGEGLGPAFEVGGHADRGVVGAQPQVQRQVLLEQGVEAFQGADLVAGQRPVAQADEVQALALGGGKCGFAGGKALDRVLGFAPVGREGQLLDLADLFIEGVGPCQSRPPCEQQHQPCPGSPTIHDGRPRRGPYS